MYQYKHYTSADAGEARLVSSLRDVTLGIININEAPADTITIYDAGSIVAGVEENPDTAPADAEIIGIIDADTYVGPMEFQVNAKKGIVLGFGASFAGDITVGIR